MAVASVALSHLSGATLRHWLYPVHYAQQITAQAERYGIDPTLVASVIKAESNWVPNAESSVGAQGLMQVMPETARDLARRGYVDSSRYDPTDLMDPETNIAYGTAYLASLMKATGSEERAIASYNAGPNAVSGWEGEGDSFSDAIQYPETRLYLEKVQSALDHYRELYPQGLQDDGSQP
ncbi:lytic transglycosylase domain-containing protein [Muricaecibacterium torontonense]|uniref:Lytic transglycosylase domain-containing protein n=2 Tax=Muricaecibacterium torontonense TaxID=3032871 RepID=A0A4S2F4W0_9ACTN|nr:lytic transglycosylase domain-containing protein [Muricaecibacterium torontonense]